MKCKTRRRKKPPCIVWITLLLSFSVLGAAGGTLASVMLTDPGSESSEYSVTGTPKEIHPETDENASGKGSEEEAESGNIDTAGSEDWKLILVNSTHPVPEDYEVTLTLLSNGRQVDSRIYPELQEMFDDCRAAGYQLFVREGYRTHEDQQQLMDERIQAYRDEGYSQEEAERLAKQWVAVPGTSEHELGIAVDINADTSISSSEEVYGWLEQNSFRYGFILRYPADKTEITGISNEPWHFRYVGKEAASEIYEEGLCLEEYLGL